MPESVCQYSSFTTEQKDTLFMEFYDMGYYKIQNTYLFDLIEKCTKRKAYKKYRVNPHYSQRNWTYRYCDPINNQRVSVCQEALLSIFYVTVWRLWPIRGTPIIIIIIIIMVCVSCVSFTRFPRSTWNINTTPTSPKTTCLTPSQDQRVRHTSLPHKIKDEDKEEIRKHIGSFPKYQSHYSRSRTPNKAYISSVHSIQEMFNLYERHFVKISLRLLDSVTCMAIKMSG